MISEPDWRLLTKLKPLALDRLCKQVLAELTRIASDKKHNHHERYLSICQLIQEKDKRIARIFDGLSRSNALSRLSLMREAQLFTEEELKMFASEIQRVPGV